MPIRSLGAELGNFVQKINTLQNLNIQQEMVDGPPGLASQCVAPAVTMEQRREQGHALPQPQDLEAESARERQEM